MVIRLLFESWLECMVMKALLNMLLLVRIAFELFVMVLCSIIIFEFCDSMLLFKLFVSIIVFIKCVFELHLVRYLWFELLLVLVNEFRFIVRVLLYFLIVCWKLVFFVFLCVFMVELVIMIVELKVKRLWFFKLLVMFMVIWFRLMLVDFVWIL